MITSEITFRLKRDLKLRKRPTSGELFTYAEKCGARRNANISNGNVSYDWTEQNYQVLKEIYEE